MLGLRGVNVPLGCGVALAAWKAFWVVSACAICEGQHHHLVEADLHSVEIDAGAALRCLAPLPM